MSRHRTRSRTLQRNRPSVRGRTEITDFRDDENRRFSKDAPEGLHDTRRQIEVNSLCFDVLNEDLIGSTLSATDGTEKARIENRAVGNGDGLAPLIGALVQSLLDCPPVNVHLERHVAERRVEVLHDGKDALNRLRNHDGIRH